ncbi:MAG: LPS assembly lipoprotein LptE [Acetobacteraceae bacterium]|jgi:LPS-assembly lipoprotein|nr:LPS assembly lipoprotein LptE [Acetobacteraceae bacterium]
MRRRALFRVAPLLALGACGFRPVHGDAPLGRGGPNASGDLAATRVALIADREGVLLRRALVERLGSNTGVPALYQLSVQLAVRRDQVGVRQDQTETRSRVVATAEYVLTPLSPPGDPLVRGRVSAADAFNVGQDQFFAAQLSGEAAMQRLAERLAEDISGQLAAFYARRRAAAARAT